jgi:cell division protein ZipA
VAAELRWILLGLSLPLLAGIWWWTARRAGRTPGNSELRESAPAFEPPRYADSDDDMPPEPAPPPPEWGVSPFEPLNIRTADFDHVPVLDGPMMVSAEPAPAPAPPPSVLPMFTTGPVSEHGDGAALGPSAPNAAELQRIVTIRVCAVGETRWSGSQLMAALELHGLAYGRYQVFHRKHADGRSLFCVASLIEPGTFDVAEMADQEYRGVTLFAVLPGPIQPVETMDEMLGTARGLAEELSGMVQDAKGMPLSPQRAAALREDIVRFQASLPGN